MKDFVICIENVDISLVNFAEGLNWRSMEIVTRRVSANRFAVRSICFRDMDLYNAFLYNVETAVDYKLEDIDERKFRDLIDRMVREKGYKKRLLK